MVLIAPLVGAAVFLSGFAAALPTSSYDSSSNSNYGSSSDSSSNYGSSDNSNSNYGSSSSDSNSNYGSSNDNSNSNYGSSDNSNYGSSNSNYGSSNSNYGNSNSNYGDSSNNYGGNSYSSSSNNNYGGNNYDSTSTSSTYDSYSTSTYDSYSSSTSAYNSYSTPSYGSGSSNYWGGSGYEDCVNQCIAQFGNSGGSSGGSYGYGGSYQATATSGSYGSTGTGATHTVIVAPTQGVFRMVPFATNASVGDTIEFHWGANEHTVTKSSALLPCNKSSEAPVFASGEHNESFVFTQVVNDTQPTFYYCGTPGHCEKGMFGVINPQMAAPGSPTSLGGMMQSMAANDSDLSAYSAYSSNVTSNNAAASSWGENFDMSSLPAWSQSLFATNVLYTRAVIGMNADVYTPENGVDLSSVATTPLMLPMDLSTALDAATAPAAPTDAGATPAAAAATDPAAASTTAKPSGASALASPRLLVAGAVVLATIFAL
ncbi:hypothetical protein B0H12DRAFT_1007567 [Mycena haematopus]|nr:hypothetical protein B0H12DRAFT_1007567 [Mycena haematopus]